MKVFFRMFIFSIILINFKISSYLHTDINVSLDEEAKNIFRQCKEFQRHMPLGYSRYFLTFPKPAIPIQRLNEVISEFYDLMIGFADDNEILYLDENQFTGSYKYIINPYILKRHVNPSSEIITIGDIHGSVHSVLRHFIRLKKQGYISDDLKITRPNIYFVFLGDYSDKGRYGIETWYLLMLLKMQNPENVFMLKGNHETFDVFKQCEFSAELKIKYDTEIQVRILKLFETLPSAIFFSSNNKSIMFCHGGLPVNYKNELIIRKSAHLQNEIIQILSIENMTIKKLDSLYTEINFLHGYFLYGDEIQRKSNDESVLIVGNNAAKKLLNPYGVVSIIRGHQHYRYIGEKQGKPVAISTREKYSLSENKMMGLAPKVTISLESAPHFVYTLASSPEGMGYLFDKEGYAIIKNDHNEWKMTPYIYDLPLFRNNTTVHYFQAEPNIFFHWQ